MTDINLESLSVDELNKLKNGIDTAIERRKNGELVALREKVDALIDQSPFTLEEVLEARKLRKPVAPKYQNPSDASQKWTGRGRMPRWVSECLEAGQTLDDLLI